MQYLVYSINQSPEAAAPLTPEKAEVMGKFMGEAMQAGKIVTTGGLEGTSKRLKLENGKFSVTDGPYIEAKELMGGFAVIQADSLEEAVEWCKRFRSIVGDGETEIVRLFGPQ